MILLDAESASRLIILDVLVALLEDPALSDSHRSHRCPPAAGRYRTSTQCHTYRHYCMADSLGHGHVSGPFPRRNKEQKERAKRKSRDELRISSTRYIALESKLLIFPNS